MNTDPRQLIDDFLHEAADAWRNVVETAYNNVVQFPGTDAPNIGAADWETRILTLRSVETIRVLLGQELDRVSGPVRPRIGYCDHRLLNPHTGEPIVFDEALTAIRALLQASRLIEEPGRMFSDLEGLALSLTSELSAKSRTDTTLAFVLGVRVVDGPHVADGWELRNATPAELALIGRHVATAEPLKSYEQIPVIAASEQVLLWPLPTQATVRGSTTAATCRQVINGLRLNPDVQFEVPLIVSFTSTLLVEDRVFEHQNRTCFRGEAHDLFHELLVETAQTQEDDADPDSWEVAHVDDLEEALRSMGSTEVATVAVTAHTFSALAASVSGVNGLIDNWKRKDKISRRIDVARSRLLAASRRIGAWHGPGHIERSHLFEHEAESAEEPMEEERVLLNLVVAIEAIVGADDTSGEQDRAKRRAVALAVREGENPQALWDTLRRAWSARNKIMHGDLLDDKQRVDVRHILPRMRSVAASVIVRSLEIIEAEGLVTGARPARHLKWLLEELDRGSVDPVENARLRGLRLLEIAPVGTFVQEFVEPTTKKSIGSY